MAISIDHGDVYQVTDSNLYNRTYEEIPNDQPPYVYTMYDVKDFYEANVQSLGIGEHTINIYLGFSYSIGDNPEYLSVSSYLSYNFTVSPPAITCISPFYLTYDNNTVPLVFKTNEQLSWMGYSLDGQANLTINGNSTLTNLAEGNHSLIVYANDTFGNMGKSDMVFFNVSLPAPTPSPTLTPLASATPSASVPEFPAWIALPLIAMATLVTALALTRRKASKYSNHLCVC